MKPSFAIKAAYWLEVVSLGLVLGLGLQFAQAWVAPTAAPPLGNVAGPLTTGANQTKIGTLTTGGLAAPSFVDSDNATRYVNPSGTSVLWALNVASLSNCDLKTDAAGLVTCGVDATAAGSGVTSLSAGSGVTLSPNPITSTGTISLNTAAIAACTNSTTNKIYWDGANNRFACGTDQSGSGSDVGSWCGAAFVPLQDNMPSNVWPCKGQNVLSGCPTGYTYRSVSTGSGEVATCVKN